MIGFGWAPARPVYRCAQVIGLYLRGRRPRIEFNQVFFRFQLAKVVVIMTVDWVYAADGRLAVRFWLYKSI